MEATVPPQTSELEFSLELEAEPRFLGTARMFAAAVARRFNVDEDVVQDLKVAVSEACSNAIKSHLAGRVADPIRVTARRAEQTLVFEVVDRGTGFDPALASPPDLAAVPLDDPSEMIEGGIGLVLIHALFPDVQIVPNETGGTTVRFELALP